jgi:hypothetical protein
MDANIKRVHYYHADGSALGGQFERPLQQQITVQASVSLPPVGGYATSHAEKFHLEGLLSFESAHTQVAGSAPSKTGPWTTLVTSVVEGLNVLNIFTVDRIVAQISTEHPREGYNPKVNFVGTRFEGVRIAGHPVEIILDLDVCKQGAAGEFPGQPCIQDSQFLARVAEQRRRMADERSLPQWSTDRTIPNWVRERYQWDNSDTRPGKDSVLCTVVKEIRGQFPGQVFGNVFDVPDFGKGFLGELLVDSTAFRLVMARFEVGCPVTGDTGVGSANIEGRTHP